MRKDNGAASVGAHRGSNHQAVSWWGEYSTTPLTAGMTHGQIAQMVAILAMFVVVAWFALVGACALHDWMWCR